MHRGGFVMSLDFELMWGVRDHKTVAQYGRNVRGVRDVVPRMLDLFGKFGISCTWATVGLLFFEERDALLAAIPEARPDYRDRSLSPYPHLQDIGENEKRDPYHFGLSLLRRIKAVPDQEIATHTFSHFYCLEPGQTIAQFRADIAAAVTAADALSVKLQSIVFPRNQFRADYLAVCREFGMMAYRGNEPGFMYRAAGKNDQTALKRAARLTDAYLDLSGANSFRPEKSQGMTNIPSSRFLRPWSSRLASLEQLRLKRILGAMETAATRGEMFHLWFHPHNFGVNQDENFAVLQRICRKAVELDEKFGWPSMTMAAAADATTRC